VTDGSAKRAAAVLATVVNGTPADQAGLKAGDAIVAVDGNPIDGSLSLVAQIHEFTVGDTVAFTVVRNGQPRNVNVTLIANRPRPRNASRSDKVQRHVSSGG